MTPSADTLLVHGRIATLDPHQPFVSALAIRDGMIVAAGSDEDIAPWRGTRTRVIECEGRTVVPGLNDAHTHFIRTAINFAYELRWDGVPALAEALGMLRDQARRTPPPMWVQVLGGWSAHQFAERRLPTLAEINGAAPDTPTYVLHLYDRAWVNAAGLRALGWDRKTPEPPGGTIERDRGGMPTGLIVARSSLLPVISPTFRFPQVAAEDQALSTRHFMAELNRLGVTSVMDAGGGGLAYPDQYAGLIGLARDGLLTLRIGYTLFAQRPGQERADYAQWVSQLKPGEGTDWYRFAGGGEYLVWAAADPANFAWDLAPQDPAAEFRLAEVIKLIAAHGWPFRLHATYDATAEHILNVLERVNRDIPLTALRWAIDHAEGISRRSLDRVAALGGAISIQNRMSLDGEAYLRRQGSAAASEAPPIALIRQRGIPLSCGTDGTRVTSYNPWIALHWLVTGKTLGGTRLAAPHNLLDRMEALRLFSSAGAWFTRDEGRKGVLGAGTLADLAVLSADYFTIPEDEVPNLESVLTMVGGKVVHAADAFRSLAPPPLPNGPEWLPIRHYPGYPHGRREGHATSHSRAHGAAGSRLHRWELACACEE